jgi:arginase
VATAKPLNELAVIQVRYRSHHFVGDGQRALETYRSQNVYAAAGVPVHLGQPTTPAGHEGQAPHLQLGALGGAIAGAAAQALRAGRAVLMVGGNCSHAPGLLGGLQDAYGPAARIGLVWMDAHGDLNTPHTTLTGNLGGMPVAVCAGLGHADWRERAHIHAPLPTDRILLVDVRNLDPAEATLIDATDVTIAAPAPGFPGQPLGPAVARLAERVDLLYLHLDADVLDGLTLAQVLTAIECDRCAAATGKVAAFAVVSVYFQGPSPVDLASGVGLVRGGLNAWRRYASPQHL